MILLELFCGTKSISKEAEKQGIETITLDYDKKHNPTICEDILKWNYKEYFKNRDKPDIIWASPDCRTFSIARHHHRTKDNIMGITNDAKLANKMIQRTIQIIKYLKPKHWFIENPRGRLRYLPIMKKFKRVTIYYSNYNHYCHKPTDIWTNTSFLKDEKMKKIKLTSFSLIGSGKDRRLRYKMPEQLCEHIISNVH